MVAGAGGHHAAPELVRREPGHPVVGAAQLEAEHRLHVLALQQHDVPGAPRQAGRLIQRRFARHVVDAARQDLANEVLDAATLLGSVRDEQGGVIPGATVTVRNVDTNLVRSEATGADGNFRFPNLPVGNYELTVELAGFGKYVRSGIKPVNGMRSRSNNFIIDGQDSNDPSVAGRTQLVNNTDIIQEVRLLTNQFAAEYGRAAGSVMSVTTKSGTNSFHGSGFVFNNNNVFNARSNLDKAAGREEAPWRIETQYGGTLGGPIFKNHTFFFGSYQRWTDRRLGSGFTLNGAPTEAGRQVLQSAVGGLPQIQALLKFLPAAQSPIGKTASFTYGGQNYVVTARPTRGSAGRSPTRTGATARSGPPTSVPSTT